MLILVQLFLKMGVSKRIMSYQGKELSPEFCEVVVKLKKHYDEERKTGPLISTKNSSGRVAEGFGISPVTVRRIMSSYKRVRGYGLII